MKNLTICSVSYHSGLHLAANFELTRALNGPVRWIVAQNGPAEELPSFTVVPGAAPPTAIGPGNQNIKVASYHHAAGLNATLPHVTTRFALFLDPDFFVVPPLAKILDHMTGRGLAFFGAPYAIDPQKPRRQDFPSLFACSLTPRRWTSRNSILCPTSRDWTSWPTPDFRFTRGTPTRRTTSCCRRIRPARRRIATRRGSLAIYVRTNSLRLRPTHIFGTTNCSPFTCI